MNQIRRHHRHTPKNRLRPVRRQVRIPLQVAAHLPEPPPPPATSAVQSSFSALPPSVRGVSLLSTVIVTTGLLAYGITLLPKTNFAPFDINSYRAEKARNHGRSIRSVIADQIGADALTMSGVAGWLEFDGASGNLAMNIRNRRGEPVQGANVQAMFIRGDGERGPNVLLQPDADQRYSADVKSLGTGAWGVSIVATDPSIPFGSQLLFRVEKDIEIK